jgi:hypothetical protein
MMTLITMVESTCDELVKLKPELKAYLESYMAIDVVQVSQA